MAKRPTVTISVLANVGVPHLPNYLHSDPCERSLDVADVGDDDLNSIGMAWTRALIEHAATRRQQRGYGK